LRALRFTILSRAKVLLASVKMTAQRRLSARSTDA
jgi:hypothetical protein